MPLAKLRRYIKTEAMKARHGNIGGTSYAVISVIESNTPQERWTGMDEIIPADGLDALRKELDLTQVMRLIERTARWVDPATFQLLPLWYPECARGTYLFNADWSAPRMNINRQTKESIRKREGNASANTALTAALGLRRGDRPNWSCCHIWGVDDDKYQTANVVIQDRRYFSCIANMVLLPSPLKAFTDSMIEVKAMMRICARNLYDWHCDHEELLKAVSLIDNWRDWDAYPASWPRKFGDHHPMGVVKLNDTIRRNAERRREKIRLDLSRPGKFYPLDEVRAALAYWKIAI